MISIALHIPPAAEFSQFTTHVNFNAISTISAFAIAPTEPAQAHSHKTEHSNDYRIPSIIYRMPSDKYRMASVIHRMLSVERRMTSVVHRMAYDKRRITSFFCRMPSHNYTMPLESKIFLFYTDNEKLQQRNFNYKTKTILQTLKKI
jgi:hypothetical protein